MVNNLDFDTNTNEINEKDLKWLKETCDEAKDFIDEIRRDNRKYNSKRINYFITAFWNAVVEIEKIFRERTITYNMLSYQLEYIENKILNIDDFNDDEVVEKKLILRMKMK